MDFVIDSYQPHNLSSVFLPSVILSIQWLPIAFRKELRLLYMTSQVFQIGILVIISASSPTTPYHIPSVPVKLPRLWPWLPYSHSSHMRVREKRFNLSEVFSFLPLVTETLSCPAYHTLGHSFFLSFFLLHLCFLF